MTTVVQQIRAIAPSAWAYLRECAGVEPDNRYWQLAERVRAGSSAVEAGRLVPRLDGGIGVSGSQAAMFLHRVTRSIDELGARMGWAPVGCLESEGRTAEYNTRPIRKFVRAERELISERRRLTEERDRLRRKLYEVNAKLYEIDYAERMRRGAA